MLVEGQTNTESEKRSRKLANAIEDPKWYSLSRLAEAAKGLLSKKTANPTGILTATGLANKILA